MGLTFKKDKIRYSIALRGNSHKCNIEGAFALQKGPYALWYGFHIGSHVSKISGSWAYLLIVPSLYFLILLMGLLKRRRDFESNVEQSKRVITRGNFLKNVIDPQFDIVTHRPQYQSVKFFKNYQKTLKL